MIDEIRKRIGQFHMLKKGDRVLIGLSGGADSVCLTQVLYEIAQEYELILGAVCCNHGIRGEEAGEDVRFAKTFCEERRIVFYSAEENVEERARKGRMSVEEAGREFRYETFRMIMEKEGYDKLAIAHNGDDRAETMLFHLARGTGIAGLCTMEPVREFSGGTILIRPLLWTKKVEIESWLREKKIPWRTDATNLLDVYSRNQIRHHVIPAMEQVNERAVEHMGETAEHLGDILSYIKEEEEKVYERTVSEKDYRLIVNISELNKCHIYIKKTVLYRSLAQMTGGKKDISSSHVKILLDMLSGESGKEASFMKGVRARREYDKLILFREKKEEKQIQQENILDGLNVSMRKIPYCGQEILKNEYTKQFDCAKILGELCFRFWQEGDFLYLREDGGKKKLSRFFIDAKIPQEQREQTLLLADGSHILWIVGHRISAYYKVTEKTETILEVTVTKQRIEKEKSHGRQD